MWYELVLLSLTAVTVGASYGDRTWIFQKCLRSCEGRECAYMSDAAYAAKQPFYMNWLHWTCLDECDYSCMWETVDAFQMDGTKVPQFHGKWPFIRVLGIQEPASVVFSLLNFLAHFIMASIFWVRIPYKCPMYVIWTVYALVAMNAWVWSTIFHSRDTMFTESLDYICAVGLVFYSLFALVARCAISSKVKVVSCAVVFLSALTYHVHYLLFVKFDYGYNMKVNIVVGILNGTGWTVWYVMVRRKQPYAWKAFVTIFFLSTLVLLEVLDFPPVLWTFDAHSLWHAGTVPLPLLWYSFIMDDCQYLMENQFAQKAKDNKQK